MTKNKKYHWTDDDVVAIITKAYLEDEIAVYESSLLEKDGKLSDETYDELHGEIGENLLFFLQDCFSNVKDRVDRERRNQGAEALSHHYRVYWKNPNAFQKDFKVVGHYKNLEDAQGYVLDQFKDEFTTYVIKEFKDGVEGEKDLASIPKTLFDGSNYAF